MAEGINSSTVLGVALGLMDPLGGSPWPGGPRGVAMGLGWQADAAAGQVCEEPGRLNTGSRCQNSISLHLELLFVQDLGCPCSGWVFEQICGCQCCSLTQMRNSPDTHFE